MVHELDEVDRILTNLAVLPYAINRTQWICGTCYVAVSPNLLQQRNISIFIIYQAYSIQHSIQVHHNAESIQYTKIVGKYELSGVSKHWK